VRVRPAAGSASPTLSIRSQGGSSIWSVAAVTGARTGSPISTTTVGYARSLPIWPTLILQTSFDGLPPGARPSTR